MSMNTARAGWLAATALAGLAGVASAAQNHQNLPTIRVEAATPVMSRTSTKGDVVETVPPGTILEEIGDEGDWRWVLLPPDGRGTRHSGWILVPQAPPPLPPAAAPSEADSKASKKRLTKEEQAQKQNEERVAKAKRELEKAREQYEKAVAGANDGPK